MKTILLANILFAQIAVAFGSTPLSHSEDASLERCREMTRTFMRQVVVGDARGAFDLLRPELPIDKVQFGALREKTLQQRKDVAEKYGKILGFKLVSEEHVSDFLMRMTYVEKRANHLLRWQFTFYRGAAEWKLNTFIWDDDVSKLFGHSP
jgi:hypothetical protein